MPNPHFSPLLHYRDWRGNRWRLRRLKDGTLEHGPAYAGWSRRTDLIFYKDQGLRRVATFTGKRFGIWNSQGNGKADIRPHLNFTGWDNQLYRARWDEKARGFYIW